jgi:acetyltransferase-like isoleucine patch superfamily enzyme
MTSARGSVSERLADRRRNRWLGRVLRTALSPPPPSAFGAFGSRAVIVPPARIELPSSIFIGDGVVIHEGVWLSVVKAYEDITPRLEIRDRARFGRFCQVSCVGEIIVEEDVLASDQVQIGDTYHEYQNPDLPATEQLLARPKPVRICRNVLLGLGAIVLPGITIGEGAYVVENSVVTRDVAPHTVVAGNPARVVGDVGRRPEPPKVG